MDTIEKFYYWKIGIGIWMRVLKFLTLVLITINLYQKSKVINNYPEKFIYIMIQDTSEINRHEDDYSITEYHPLTKEPLKPVMKCGASYRMRVNALKKWQLEHRNWEKTYRINSE